MHRCPGCMCEYDETFEICPYCGYILGTGADDPSQLPPGTELHGRYTLGRALGRGGFGITYIAWDNLLEQAVAVKEYLPGVFATRTTGQKTVSCYSENARAQFHAGLRKTLEESRSLARFSHLDSVVRVLDCVEENNTAYIIMEYLRGRTVSQLLRETGCLSWEETREIMTRSIRLTIDSGYTGSKWTTVCCLSEFAAFY